MRETRRYVLRSASAIAAALAGAGTVSAQQQYPEYDSAATYWGDDRVVYDGSVWEAQWWTRGTTPSTGAAVWEQIEAVDGGSDGGSDDGGSTPSSPSWEGSTTYTDGDRVVHDGYVWEANWWTRGDEPGAGQWGPWTQIEAVDGGSDDGGTEDPNQGPSAAITVSPSAPSAGETVTLDASGSSDPDGDTVSYEWDVDGAGTATGVQYTVSFGSAGDYGVSLTVTDGNGASDTASSTVPVSADNGTTGPDWDEHPVMAYEFGGAAPADKLTHVIQTFGSVSGDGSLSAPYDAGGIDGVKTILSIGGWGNSQGFPDLAKDQASRETFASECVSLMRDRGLDGIDIDWEHPGSGGPSTLTSYPDDPQNFAAMLEECRRQFDVAGEEDGQHYYLTAALNSTESVLSLLPHDRVMAALDYAKMMTYDMHAAGWSNQTNHNSPLYANSRANSDLSIHNSLEYMRQQGWPNEKLVMGLAFYGREFTGVQSSANNGLLQSFSGDGGAYGFADIQRQFGGHTRYWDDEAKVPYKFDGSSLLSYDDEESIAIKAEYAAERSHPVMYWASGHDPNETLVDALNAGLGK